MSSAFEKMKQSVDNTFREIANKMTVPTNPAGDLWTKTDDGYCIEASCFNDGLVPLPELQLPEFPYFDARAEKRDGEILFWEWIGPNGKKYTVFND